MKFRCVGLQYCRRTNFHEGFCESLVFQHTDASWKNNFVFSFSPDRTMQEIVYKLVPDLQERKLVLICVIPTAYVYIWWWSREKMKIHLCWRRPVIKDVWYSSCTERGSQLINWNNSKKWRLMAVPVKAISFSFLSTCICWISEVPTLHISRNK